MPSSITTEQHYRGRFAPSPTGDLHFGSLIAAIASYLEARQHDGQWLVRIEDIDPPREIKGSADRIMEQLRHFGMSPDEDVLYQSTRTSAYEEAIQSLIERGDAYWCGCSRSDLPPSGVYPGTCSDGLPEGRKPRSVRLRTNTERIVFNDRIQGPISMRADQPGGDFIIRRADGLPAYQLAVVVDDASQGISDVVRGADLLDSTPRQLLLQERLGLQHPGYAHVPLVTGNDGRKLSKRMNSDPVSKHEPAIAIRAALQFLGQQPPETADFNDLWEWALSEWDIAKVPRKREIPLDHT